ncbi:hypothetical protein AALB39_28835 [Lachnospiraceae bacterium 54-53]
MTDIIIAVLNFFSSIVESSFPALTADNSIISQVQAAVTAVSGFIAKVNFLVPIDTVFQILGLIVVFKVGKFGVFVVNWVIRRIADIIP